MRWLNKAQRRKHSRGLRRLARIRAINVIIDRLSSYKRGKIFMVDTNQLKSTTAPALHNTERHSPARLAYATIVSNIVTYTNRTLRIEIINEQLTYIIY
jgi:hypothetical protein